MSDNIFEKIAALTTHTTRILLAPGERVYDEETGESYSVPMAGSKVEPIAFDIHAITPNQSIEADAKITAVPPPIYEEQPSPRGVGTVKVLAGRDEEDPAYLAELHRQRPVRDAHITLMGCPAIREGAPGNTTEEKAQAILERFPAFILSFLALNIERISIYNRVGNDEVDAFFREGSADTNTGTSKSSSGRSRAGKKSSLSKSSTARTSNTKRAKPPASGEA